MKATIHTFHGHHIFDCPGCKEDHAIPIETGKWTFNGDFVKPTYSPSVLVYANKPEKRCHSFIRDGKIQFLDDCYHDLKGQTVDLPPCTYNDDDDVTEDVKKG